ncbi:MAG: raffinose/stachyose/melibiose transport system substrate-binding protein [Kribbellaceae bacterium]|nr:raffinose/stachyose/melibiose transport system substrate-binding protein [Kribbellaceae bacterium]
MTFRPRSRGLVAFAAACTLALTACSAGSLGSSDKASAGSVAITYLIGNQEQDLKEANQLTKDFTAKNPGITIKLDTRPAGTEGDNIVKTRLSTGDMADVFIYNTGSLFQAIAPQKNLVPISDQPYIGNLDDNFKKTVTAGDQVYGVPSGGFMGGAILYSIPVYTRLGLKVPTTWAEFMANNAKIKAAGIAPVIQTYGETWTSQLFVLGDYANVEAQVPDFAAQYTANQAKYATTPAALAGFEHIQQVKDAGFLNKDFASAKLNDGVKAVATGEAAHYPQLGGTAANIENVAPGKSKDVGFFALPGNDAATNKLTVWPGTSAMYIPKSVEGDKLEAAKKFIAFSASQEGCDANIKGAPPQGPFLSKACELPSDVSQVAKDTQAYFDAGKASPALEFKSPIKGPALEQICIQVGTGQEDAKKAAALYDQDVKKQAQQLGLPGWD